MLVYGCLKYRNKYDRKRKYFKLRKELGNECSIWTENKDKMIIYQYDDMRQVI